MEKRSYLKIISIYSIACGVFLLIIGFCYGVILLATINEMKEITFFLDAQKVFATYTYVFCLFALGIFYLPMGITGLKNRKKPEKVNQLRELGIVGIILSIVVFITSLVAGGAVAKVLFFFNFIIMLAYYYVANQIVKENKD